MAKKCVYGKPMVPITTRVPKEVFKELRKMAREQHKTVSAFMCEKLLAMMDWKPDERSEQQEQEGGSTHDSSQNLNADV